MNTNTKKLIAEHDRHSPCSANGMEADPKDQPKYMERINAALDERLRLMALRDETPAMA